MTNTKTPKPSALRRLAPTKKAIVGKAKRSKLAKRKLRQIKRKSNY